MEGNKGNLRDDTVENGALLHGVCGVGVGGWKEEVCRDRVTGQV